MTSMIGVWQLESFLSGSDKPFGDKPIGTLVFFQPEEGPNYMGAHLTSQAGENGPSFAFSATFEFKEKTYSFTPTASNDHGKFPVDQTTPPKNYRIIELKDGGWIFEESWSEKAVDKVVRWKRLHDKGQ